ncbi:hypothetical protein BDF14DRAFT_1776407 [Spinellus fusiger]|nr:hypothetical protein BDF14DRAFT_1776407 [Spinellus fusiger]
MTTPSETYSHWRVSLPWQNKTQRRQLANTPPLLLEWQTAPNEHLLMKRQGDELFLAKHKRYSSEKETPVEKTPSKSLGDDCLELVFYFCSDYKALCAASAVSRQWRQVVTDPSRCAWSAIRMSCYEFKHVFWRDEQNIYINQYFGRVEVLELYEDYKDRDEYKDKPYTDSEDERYNEARYTPSDDNLLEDFFDYNTKNYNPCVQLKELWLDTITLISIMGFTQWTRNLSVLWCTNIPYHKGSFQLNFLDNHQTLEKFSLEFNDDTSFDCDIYLCSKREIVLRRAKEKVNGLPSTLKVLSLLHLMDHGYNYDESYWDTHSIDTLDSNYNSFSLDAEDQETKLLIKYIPLQGMHQLKSLSIGGCSNWTASVWRQCLVPRSQHLEDFLLMGCETLDSDIEQAKAEFIGEMVKVRRLVFFRSFISQGILLGLLNLKKHHGIAPHTVEIIPSDYRSRTLKEELPRKHFRGSDEDIMSFTTDFTHRVTFWLGPVVSP